MALVVAATIPLAIVAGNNAWTTYQVALDQGLRDSLILREVSAARHGAAVGALRELLTGLAAHAGLQDLSPTECDAALARQQALKPDRYSNFWLLDADGVLLCSGLPAPRGKSYADLDYVPAVQASRAFTLGNFTIGVISGRAVLPGAAPILGPDDALRAIVGGSLFLDFFLRVDPGMPIASPHHVWLLDTDGTILPLGSAAVSALPPAQTLAEMLAQRAATVQGIARDGSFHAWSIVQLESGLHLLVGLPVAEARQAARMAFRQRIIELTVFILACLAVILVGVELGVSRPLRHLADRVHRWTPGRPYQPRAGGNMPMEVRELDRALTAAAVALREREEALTAALRQRDLLMAEIHHRVKNNLQIVASLLSLQADGLHDDAARTAFAVARDRVQALAMLHRHLYTHQSFDRLSLRPFLNELARQLVDALGAGAERGVSMRIEADAIELGPDASSSLALLLTEAVSNSMRHAFTDGRDGTITISLRVEGDEVLLRVQDDGIGMPDGADAAAGLGMKLIKGFAGHLGGVAEFSGGAGSCVSVRFPLEAPSGTLRDAA